MNATFPQIIRVLRESRYRVAHKILHADTKPGGGYDKAVRSNTALAWCSWRSFLDRVGIDSAIARNCRPAGVTVVGRTKKCRVRPFCPFCYAREVVDVYAAIELYIYGTHKSEEPVRDVTVGFTEVEYDPSAEARLRVYADAAAVESAGEYDSMAESMQMVKAFIRDPAQRRREDAPGMLGKALLHVFRCTQGDLLSVERHGIMILTPGWRQHYDHDANPAFCDKPSRKWLERQFSERLVFPSELVNEFDATQVELFQAIMRGVRTVARVGCLRRPKKGGNDDA